MKVSSYVCAAFAFTSLVSTPLASTANDLSILKKGASGNVGFTALSRLWDDKNEFHADDSYRTFKRVLGREPGRYDFYYQLRIAPQFPASQDWCQSGIDVLSFLGGFFGTSDASLALLKMSLSYTFDAGATYSYVSNDAPLLMIGSGGESGKTTTGNGCFFDVSPYVETPMLRYGGGGENQDRFNFRFAVNGGEALDVNALSTLFDLFKSATAAASIVALNAPAATLVDKATDNFQRALKKAGTYNDASIANFKMKVSDREHQRIEIALPDLFGDKAPNGNIIIYLRRTASILLDSSEPAITSGYILSNDRLARRQCGLDATTKGSCAAAKSFRTALYDTVKATDDKATPLKLYNLKNNDSQKKIVDVCSIVRTALREEFRLSVIDDTYVRWAIAKESGLLTILNDKDKLNALAKTAEELPESITGACYNQDDEKILANFDAKRPRKDATY